MTNPFPFGGAMENKRTEYNYHNRQKRHIAQNPSPYFSEIGRAKPHEIRVK
jgi:hypothetical protein